ncbi:MAG: four-carbon acid sugar kinase family protein [Anaerolineales bacterium]|nr:four-carbon acid sugar kinase family protein [Anaerolineales bacterium]
MAVLGVLADDFTGACDTGVQFARAGMRTRMVMSSAMALKRFGIDVVAYSTETRNLESNDAYRRVRDAAAFLSRNQIDIVFKKIDSTLRGPVAAELDGALDESGFHLAVVCPAFPANRRTLQDGILFVDGKPLESVTHAPRPPPSPQPVGCRKHTSNPRFET